MNTTKQLLGMSKYNELFEATVNEQGIIERIESYYYIAPKHTYDNNAYLVYSGSDGSVEIKGKNYTLGMPMPKLRHGKKVLEIYNDAYRSDGFSCEDCGLFHDSVQYYDVSFVITDDSRVYCKGCVPFEEIIRPLQEASQLFKAKDMTHIQVPDNFEEIDTLFCDSSGWGSPGERALTKEQAISRAEELIESNQGKELFVGLTGIGQFQVYVTVWAKLPDTQGKKKRRKAA